MAGPGEPNPQSLRILALWIFRDELREVDSGELWAAHLSQPMGNPLHRHEGFLEVDGKSLTLEEKDDRKEIPLSEIEDLQVSFDENFRQFKDSRGLLPPMHFSFGNDAVYIFTRGSRFGYRQGKNTALSDALQGPSRSGE